MVKKVVKTDKAPLPVGPYSQAIIYGNLVFVAGQISIDPATNTFVQGTIEEEARRVLDNIKAILEEAGSSMEQVLKTTVFLADIEDFGKFNQVYQHYFPSHPPARSCIQAGRLPKGMKVEVDVIAHL
ncbi:reactive intermediate/imine deaminase [bacterium (candidate division B38) B3_B38]|nr:MAG: reactive intermediate/imine deaminase [bacterium (candidate division B38) B3_B38]